MKSKNDIIDQLWTMIKDPETKTLAENLGIEITHISEAGLKAKMPVDQRTKQPYGLLHGGASVALAETLASIAAVIHIDTENEIAVGLEINANHVRSVTTGFVYGESKPIHLGKKTQVWAIEIKNADGKLVSICRCTIAVVPRVGTAAVVPKITKP